MYRFNDDSSEEVWANYYRHFYGKSDWEFWNLFDYDNLLADGERKYARCSKGTGDKYGVFKECTIGGEVDFNFNSDDGNWRKAKYEYYYALLKNDNIGEAAIKQLKTCRDNQYSPYNLSVVLRTGGLNNLKGKLSQGSRPLDRFDTFVFVLNDYFEKRNKIDSYEEDYMHIVFSQAWCYAKKNRECLYEYLKLFADIEDYFKKNYRIQNVDLIKKLIDSGGKPIDGPMSRFSTN